MAPIQNKANTANAILFDAIALCVCHGSEALPAAVELLIKFLQAKDSNTRCVCNLVPFLDSFLMLCSRCVQAEPLPAAVDMLI